MERGHRQASEWSAFRICILQWSVAHRLGRNSVKGSRVADRQFISHQ